MISPHECAEILSITDVRVKQILKELIPDNEIFRTKPENGQIKLSPSQIKTLIGHRGMSYRPTLATFGNEKGGVGKSLITINVAIKKAQQGAKVLIIDLDPEACATNFLLRENDFNTDFITMLEVFKNNLPFSDAVLPTRYEFLDVIPCRGKARRTEKYVRDENLGQLMKNKLGKLKEKYDLILFEVPPTFSNIIASAYISSDIVVIPTFPDSWSLESVMLTIEDIQEESAKWGTKIPDIRVVLNKYRPDRNASKDAWDTIMKEFGSYVLPFQIKESADLQNSINDGKSIYEIRSPKIIRESIAMLGDLVCPLTTQATQKIQ
ncbi:MAG: ParA family protein [Bdellovibrionota bacterium]